MGVSTVGRLYYHKNKATTAELKGGKTTKASLTLGKRSQGSRAINA